MTIKAVNPFICNNPIKTFCHNTTSKAVDLNSIPTGDDIIAEPVVYGITAKFITDRANKVSTFINPDILQAKMLMSGNANKLLVFIAETLTWNQDYIKLSGLKIKNFMKAANISSRTTIGSAVRELCRYGFITPGMKQGYYWINPHRIFNGNRIKAYPAFLESEQNT